MHHLSLTRAIDYGLHHKEIDISDRYWPIYACSMCLVDFERVFNDPGERR